jgi:hypothetical protein
VTRRVEGYSFEFHFGGYSYSISVFMEVTEFRFQSELGRAHSHERIYLGRGGGGSFSYNSVQERSNAMCSTWRSKRAHSASCYEYTFSTPLYLRGAQIPGARPPRGLHFVLWRLTFVGHQCRTWFLRNVGTPLPDCKALHPARHPPSTLLLLPGCYYPAAMFCPYWKSD